MKCKYSLTFEFETAQPITVKGEATARNVRTVLARAADDATDRHKFMNWSSLVIVLERDVQDKEVEKEVEDIVELESKD
jgi:hypothetical protein